MFPDSPSLNPTSTLTLAAWIRPRGVDGVAPHGLFSKRADYLQSQFTFFLWLGDTLWVDLDSENDRLGGTRPLVNDRWTHVAMVYDGRLDAGVRVRVFVDDTGERPRRVVSSAAANSTGWLRSVPFAAGAASGGYCVRHHRIVRRALGRT